MRARRWPRSPADVFAFPSRTDTFGLVLLEALASGLPVAAFPVAGPRDVIGDVPVGRLSEDLRAACLDALQISRIACVEFAAKHSWEASARAFIENMWVEPEAAPREEAGDLLPIHPAPWLERLARRWRDAIRRQNDKYSSPELAR